MMNVLFCLALAGLASSLHANDRVLLDFNMKTPPPADWAVEGYAFGTHTPIPGERQKYALATHSQRYVKQGRMTSPGFTIESDYLKIDCAGTYHPTEVAVVDNTSQDIYFGEHGLFYSLLMVSPGDDKSLAIDVMRGKATISKCRIHELKSFWE